MKTIKVHNVLFCTHSLLEISTLVVRVSDMNDLHTLNVNCSLSFHSKLENQIFISKNIFVRVVDCSRRFVIEL